MTRKNSGPGSLGRQLGGVPPCVQAGASAARAVDNLSKRVVDNVWGGAPATGVQTRDGPPQIGLFAPGHSRSAVVASKRRLTQIPQPGRHAMPEQVTPISSPRVLYIEDSPEARALVRRVLQSHGFDVIEASDGLAGIDLALQHPPDLILCDIQLPGIDGYETAIRLRSHRPLDNVPIVVLTGQGDRGLSLSVGADGFLEKPFDVNRFPDQLRAYIKGKRDKVKAPEERRRLREYSQALTEKLEATVRELEGLNRRLLAAARSKSEFMQNLSHELATPLTPITGYVKMLRSTKLGPLTPQQTRALDSMGISVERLSRTIDNLVDFATMEGGEGGVTRALFDAQALVKSVFDESRAKAKARRVHLELQGRAERQAWGDERKLRQALANLIDNSIKFSPHGSHVLVCLSEEPERVWFEVYDQGEGVLPEEGEKVFEPFFHADRGGEERAPGAGLGLPVARQIIEAHGGRVLLESPPKTQPEGPHHFSGTKVSFWLPTRETAPARSMLPTPLFSQGQ
jgi:signal transduction histidine kinase